MFYVIDLSKPRKYIITKVGGKYDDIILDLKLHPKKLNRALAVAVVIGAVAVSGGTIHAASFIDPNQYNYLLNHYTNDLGYPKEFAEKVLNSMNTNDLHELYSNVQYNDVFMAKAQPIIDAGKKIIVKLFTP